MRMNAVFDGVGGSARFAVSGCVAAALVSRRDASTMLWVVGGILNAVLAKVLKRVINQARPEGARTLDPGMPSSHAMSLFFLATFVVCAANHAWEVKDLLMRLGASAVLLAYATTARWDPPPPRFSFTDASAPRPVPMTRRFWIWAQCLASGSWLPHLGPGPRWGSARRNLCLRLVQPLPAQAHPTGAGLDASERSIAGGTRARDSCPRGLCRRLRRKEDQGLVLAGEILIVMLASPQNAAPPNADAPCRPSSDPAAGAALARCNLCGVLAVRSFAHAPCHMLCHTLMHALCLVAAYYWTVRTGPGP